MWCVDSGVICGGHVWSDVWRCVQNDVGSVVCGDVCRVDMVVTCVEVKRRCGLNWTWGWHLMKAHMGEGHVGEGDLWCPLVTLAVPLVGYMYDTHNHHDTHEHFLVCV